MFRLFNIFSVAGRKLLLLSGSYDLRTDVLQGHWEQVASAFLKIRPRKFVFSQILGEPSAEQEYTISGVILEGNVLITAPEGYELHPVYNPPYTDLVGWERQITLYPDENMRIALTTIQVRLNALELGTFRGKISHVSTNLLTQYVEVIGDCEQQEFPPHSNILHGYLYNSYAIQQVGDDSPMLLNLQMSTDGWMIPDLNSINTLISYLGGSMVAGGKLKEIGTAYWLSPNTGATNEVEFNMKASGYRDSSNPFAGKPTDCAVWVSQSGDILNLKNTSASAFLIYFPLTYGASVRLVRPATPTEMLQADGVLAAVSYTGNDGKSYRVTKIGTQVWLADNLAETKYRDGSSIPNVIETLQWNGLTTGARCAYNNNENNV